MASIKDLRSRSNANRELIAIQQQRIHQAIADNLASEKTISDTSSLAAKITSSVSKAVIDFVSQFEAQCEVRGLKASEIRRAVTVVNSAFELVPVDTEFNEMKQAVAEYLFNHTNLYDEFGVFNQNSANKH